MLLEKLSETSDMDVGTHLVHQALETYKEEALAKADKD